MTGLVVVSHSRALADAAVDLAEEMLHHGEVRIEVAAGLDESTFGTDATAIAAAVTAADDGSGVVVLMDLGSAVMSAELALDLIDPEVRERALLCPAPLVEGLVVAAVAAAGGAGPTEVAAEATGALAAKLAHLGEAPPAQQRWSAQAEATAEVTITNRHGLHARPAARLVQCLREYDAEVLLRNLDSGTGPVPARSLSRVATLGALQGHRLEVSASGPQAREAVAAMVDLAEREFDETAPQAPPPPAPVPTGPLPASPGIAVGPVVRLHAPVVEPPDEPAAAPNEEWQRLRDAVARARDDLLAARHRTVRMVAESEARIFDVHLALLDDADLLADVRRRIDAGASAAHAWTDGVGRVADSWEHLPDDYLRARAADVRAVGQQVLHTLLGAPAPTIAAEGLLVAEDLTPAEIAGLDTEAVRGLLLARGSPTGHTAILARARGIPALVAAGRSVLGLAEGTVVAIDGVTGELFVDPAPDVVRRLEERRSDDQARAAAALVADSSPAVTLDGVTVAVAANVGSLADARAAAEHGADVAGLVRTEFLYLERTEPPTVAEQVETYLSLAAALEGRRLTLRTLDVGGDKALPYVHRAEANPFLGLRGLRLTLAEPRLLLDQLQAIVTVARQTPVSLMFPMVSTVQELTSALAVLDTVLDTVLDGDRPDGFRVGIMVEVPAAALKTRALAPYVDFWSIGTNDLTQYTLAAERGDPSVAAAGDALDPAVLRLIEIVCRHAGGHPVAVCGELAADPAAVPLLLALGVRELSVAPAAVPAVKQAVRRSAATDPGLVSGALAAAGPAEVRTLLSE